MNRLIRGASLRAQATLHTQLRPGIVGTGLLGQRSLLRVAVEPLGQHGLAGNQLQVPSEVIALKLGLQMLAWADLDALECPAMQPDVEVVIGRKCQPHAFAGHGLGAARTGPQGITQGSVGQQKLVGSKATVAVASAIQT